MSAYWAIFFEITNKVQTQKWLQNPKTNQKEVKKQDIKIAAGPEKVYDNKT